MLNYKKQAMQEAIDAAWNNPEGAELRATLFPEGKPEPDVFIQRMTDYARQQVAKKVVYKHTPV